MRLFQKGPERVRPPAAAGRFYPDNPVELRRMVEELMRGAASTGAAAPKAVIAPHAGYVYSGPIAAAAYAQLAPAKDIISRVVLLGPAHFVHVSGLASVSAKAFATPLGEVPVDTDALQKLAALPHVSVRDDAHRPEHSLEVQLPFLQVVLERFSIVPLLVGDALPARVAEVIEALWGGSETRFVISSDLSHYLDSRAAEALDKITAQNILRLDPGIAPNQACGQIAVQGILYSARRRSLRAAVLDLRNSGDTAGSPDQVVGYGAFAFSEASERA